MMLQMRIAVLGTGGVGQTLASKLVQLDHEVTMGSRRAGNEKAVTWAESAGALGHEGSFSDAGAFGEIVINATAGAASLDALAAAGAENLTGKVLIDVANPLDSSSGMPPTLTVGNTDSLGEQIQRTYPDARVVKTLNTVTADVMVAPDLVPGQHNIFVSGNDAEAKSRVTDLLRSFGWPADSILDLGDITTARGAEMYLMLWLRLFGVIGMGHFNIEVKKP